MIVICQHCDTRGKIPADKIPACGWAMIWECPDCGCTTHIDRRDGKITTRFDSFTAINARINPTPLQTVPITFNADACPDELFGDCFEKVFGPTPGGEMSGMAMLLATMQRRIVEGIGESARRLFGIPEPKQPGTGIHYKNDPGDKWKWSAYFDEITNPTNTDDGWLSLIERSAMQYTIPNSWIKEPEQ